MRKITLTNTVVASLAAVLLSACASPSYVALLESPDGSTGKIFIKGKKGEQIVEQAGFAVPLDGSKAAAPVPAEKLKQDFALAMAARPQLPERFLLYFESGDVKLTAESLALLPRIIASAAQRPGVDVSIIGHTDTVGTAEANEALALKRAQAIAKLIRDKGLKIEALSTESHGESNLLVQTPNDTPEPRNRRVEISIR